MFSESTFFLIIITKSHFLFLFREYKIILENKSTHGINIYKQIVLEVTVILTFSSIIKPIPTNKT